MMNDAIFQTIKDQLIELHSAEARAIIYKQHLAKLLAGVDNALKDISNDYPDLNIENLAIELTEDAKVLASRIADLVVEYGASCSNKVSKHINPEGV